MNWKAVVLSTILGIVATFGGGIADSSNTMSLDELAKELMASSRLRGLKDSPYFDILAYLEPVNSTLKPGPVRLKLTVVTKVECGDVTVTIEELNKLACISPVSWPVAHPLAGGGQM